MARPRILLADEHPEMRQYLAQLLSENYEIDAAPDIATALTLARARAPDLIVADVTMREAGDFQLLRLLRRDAWGEIPIVLYSGKESSANVSETELDDIVTPFSERQLLALVRAHIRVIQMRHVSIESFRLSEERFRTLKTMMTPGVWVMTPTGEVISELARWWEELTGQTSEQYTGYGYLDVVHPADKSSVLEVQQNALRNKVAYQNEFRVRQRNGSYSYVRTQGAPVCDGDGNVREWVGTMVPIDDERRAQEVLQRSEERHRTFMAMTTLAVWVTAPTGEAGSDADLYGWAELTGQTPDQYRGSGWLDALHPDDKLRVSEEWKRALRDGTPIDTEYRVRRRDGTYCWAHNQGVALRNPDGSVREWTGTVVDIDDRRRAEESLRASEEELRANFDLAGVGQVQTDPETGRYVRVNNRFCEMVGYSADELLAMTYFDVAHPEDREAGRNLLHDLLHGKINNFTSDKRYVRKDGSVLWGLATSTLIHDAHGRPLRTITMIEDVTERRQAEGLAECQKTALEMVARGVPLAEVLDFVCLAVEKQFTLELHASIQILNDERKQFRLCAAPSLPESYRQSVLQYRDSPERSHDLAFFLKGPVIVSDVTAAPDWHDVAESVRPYGIRSIWCAPIISSDQEPLGTLCLYSPTPRTPSAAERMMIENVTQTIGLAIERKEAESEREKLLKREQAAREQAEAANRVKDEFLAVVSHELRTPLNAINGWAHLLLDGGMDEASQVRALQSILRQARSQCQLIDDLLDVARIVSGKLRLELHDVDLSRVIAAAMDVVRPAAEAKQIDLVAELDRTLPVIFVDPERLQQVIWNLLSNAVKFTPERGRVAVQSRLTDSCIEIIVVDTGQGISEEFLPYVFDRFRQADSSTTRTHGGIGLGLAIVRHLIELHGGTVSATSAGRGKGAAFTIRMPVRAIRPAGSKVIHRKPELEALQHLTAENSEILKGLKVLVVEDSSEDREVLSAELVQHGATVSASACAAEALIQLDRFRPDVLVADIAMPSEDGYSLIRKIRTFPRDRGGLTPAIAVTAYAGEANLKRALEAGYQRHMAKPADPNELVRTIARLARG
jgi:PAS domain S-box-containing protein